MKKILRMVRENPVRQERIAPRFMIRLGLHAFTLSFRTDVFRCMVTAGPRPPPRTSRRAAWIRLDAPWTLLRHPAGGLSFVSAAPILDDGKGVAHRLGEILAVVDVVVSDARYDAVENEIS